jgi:CRP-like cAMP-binding protein
MFVVVTGRFLVVELGIELLPGRFFGEVGFFRPGNQRTMTVECVEDGDVLSIAYGKLLKLFVQNPEFVFHSLALSVAGTVRLSRLLVELRDKNVKLERFYDCKSNSIALIYSPAFFRSRCSKADFIRSTSLGSEPEQLRSQILRLGFSCP